MVRSAAIILGLLAASAEAGSHLTGHSPSRRLNALKKRGLATRVTHDSFVNLGPEANTFTSDYPPKDPAAQDPSAMPQQNCVRFKNEDDCISQCKAKAGLQGGGSSSSAPPPSATGKSGGGKSAAKKTKKITVAPQQGVLRFVPFAINVAQGESLDFEWGGGPHTVTKSSQFSICNATQDGSFSSGKQDAGFKFNLPINDTQPIFYYCGVQPHCDLGMFAQINPTGATAANALSISQLIDQQASSSSSVKQLLDDTNKMVGTSDAGKWADTLDASVYPDWAHKLVAENVLNTRQFYAQNPEQFAFDMDLDQAPADPAAAAPAPTTSGAPVPAPTTTGVTVVDSSPSSADSGSSSGSAPAAGYGGYGGSADTSSTSQSDTSAGGYGAANAGSKVHASVGMLALAGVALMMA